MREKYENFLLEAYKQHQSGKRWNDICVEYANIFNQYITIEAIRKRVKRFVRTHDSVTGEPKTNELSNINKSVINNNVATYEQHNSDGSIESVKEVLEDIAQFGGDKDKILNYLGYNPNEWTLGHWRVTKWDGGVGNSVKYALQYKVYPKTDVTATDIVNAVKTTLKREIEPLNFEEKKDVVDNYSDKLMEIPPIELHLGKMSDYVQTGEEYNFEIAEGRFYHIFEEILKVQNNLKCGKCLLVIGGDFFNSESDSCTSVHKIPQANNMGYIKMFTQGVYMYKRVILTLREHFKNIKVMLCAGNHARAMETFLYIALEQAFSEDRKVSFEKNYKQTQCYEYGENVIFYNHGDANLKQIIKSIPAEFGKEWGSHTYRELHMGHMHKEMTVDDDGGMITRRVGSPCSNDAWHVEKRYVGAVKKHEIFIWDKDYGLNQLIYIPIV